MCKTLTSLDLSDNQDKDNVKLIGRLGIEKLVEIVPYSNLVDVFIDPHPSALFSEEVKEHKEAASDAAPQHTFVSTNGTFSQASRVVFNVQRWCNRQASLDSRPNFLEFVWRNYHAPRSRSLILDKSLVPRFLH